MSLKTKINKYETLKIKIENSISALEDAAIEEVFKKIKEDENYKKFFFISNWQLIFACSILPYGDFSNKEFYKGELYPKEINRIFDFVFTEKITNDINELKEYICISKNDNIKVLKNEIKLGGYYEFFDEYSFNKKFKKIAKFYFENEYDYVKIIKNYLEYCKECQYFTICKEQNQCVNNLGDDMNV